MRYLLLFLFLLLTPSSASAVWFDSNWDYRVAVEVVPSKVGSTTAVTSFPVYVDLGNLPVSFFTNASTTGADIRVTESDGSTETAFEVVSFGIRLTTTASVDIDTSTTTWQLPAEALSTTVTVQAWGGGGGGGDGVAAGGSGGGGGAYASSSLILATSTNYSITIGAGGSKASVDGGNGNSGATTTFNGTQVVAAPGKNGVGGVSSNPTGGAGGSASVSVGSSTYNGGNGGNGANTGDIGGGGGEAGGSLGAGASGSGKTAGASAGTGGDGGTGGANAGSGANGTAPGGGGGGGENNSVGSTGNGASGRVTITYSVATTTEYYGELHFMADALATTSTSTFYIYYGNATATAYAVTDTYGRNAVWGGYASVYHYEHSSGDATDATGNSLTLTNNGTTPYTINKLGKGPDFGEGNTLNSFSRTSAGFAGGNFTFTQWVKIRTEPASGEYPQLMVPRTTTNAIDAVMGYRNTAGTRSVVFDRGKSGVGSFEVTEAVDLGTTDWHQLHMTYDGTTLRGYRNGNSVGTPLATSGSGSGGGNALVIAGYTGQRASAYLDETRISNTQYSASWITTEYNNQSSPATFYWVGAEETEGAPPTASSTDSGVIWFD